MHVLRSFLITLVAYSGAVDANIIQTPKENITAAHKLRKYLLNDYDRVVVPATSKNHLQMKMAITFNSVELSYDASQMIIHGWMKTEWDDDRLTWERERFEEIEYTVVGHDEIWQPDFTGYNNVDANVGVHDRTQSLIKYTGHVLWVPPVQFKIHCKADMTRWPHDVQTGVLKVGSWVYSSNVINLTDTELHEITPAGSDSEWQILRVTSEKIEKIYPCCPDDSYDHVEYNITVHRKTHRYHTVVFLPALSTALLNLLVFCLSSDDKCKLITSLFDALIVVVILLVMYSKIPLILSSVPLIVLYYTYSLALIVLTAIISVVVKNMTTTNKPLSKPIKTLVQSRFVEMFQMETNEPLSDNQIQCEETDLNDVEFKKRQILANIIDKICFIVYSCIYAFLLFHFVF